MQCKEPYLRKVLHLRSSPFLAGSVIVTDRAEEIVVKKKQILKGCDDGDQE
jgi:hypothetical protein